MKFKLALLPVVLLFAAVATAQWQQDFSHEFVRHTLILRNFYTGQKLKFSSDGTLLSVGAVPGFGPADGRVYVEAMQMDSNHLTISGERPISLFDPGTGETKLLGQHAKVAIDIQLPSENPDEAQTRALLERVFLSPAEADALECSRDEAKAFRDRMLRSKGTVSAHKNSTPGDDGEAHQLCFPGGSRGYIIGSAIRSPKPLKTPDPAYPAAAEKGETKTVVLALIVDGNGRPASIVVVGAAPTVFDLAALDAVQHWKFLPATYEDRPVAAAINVEVTFSVN